MTGGDFNVPPVILSQMDLREILESAAEGLTYSSESDRPFRFVSLESGGKDWPLSPEDFARRVRDETLEPPFEQRSLDQFFKRHIEATDPYDNETQALRPRYENLKAILASSLHSPMVIRSGRIEVKCFIVGADRDGNISGLRTESIET